jgi:hypothetical protein
VFAWLDIGSVWRGDRRQPRMGDRRKPPRNITLSFRRVSRYRQRFLRTVGQRRLAGNKGGFLNPPPVCGSCRGRLRRPLRPRERKLKSIHQLQIREDLQVTTADWRSTTSPLSAPCAVSPLATTIICLPAPAGGRRAAALYSLIESAKLNGLNPRHHFADVLARIPHRRPPNPHRRTPALELTTARRHPSCRLSRPERLRGQSWPTTFPNAAGFFVSGSTCASLSDHQS